MSIIEIIANNAVFAVGGSTQQVHIEKCWIGNALHIRGFPCRQRGCICRDLVRFVHFQSVACNKCMYGRVDFRCCRCCCRRLPQWVMSDFFSTKMWIAVV